MSGFNLSISSTERKTELLFDQVDIGSLKLKNRAVLAPMTRISADADGCVNEQMLTYYSRFAAGGFGLIITEGSYIDTAESQTYLHQPGMATPKHVEAWRALVSALHTEGAAVVAQLQHSGPQSQGNPHSQRLFAPSNIPARGEQLSMYRGEGPYVVPQEMTQEDIDNVQQAFVDSALRARDAGFDGVELHGANGYLIDAFLTDYLNQRTDHYGGNPSNRVRFAVETAQRVRAAVGEDFLVGIRISQGKVSDAHHRWAGGVDEALTIFGSLAQSGVDYIHTTEWKAEAPAFPDEDERSLAALAKQAAPNLTIIANGHIDTGGSATSLLRRGDADLVAIGKAALANSDWPIRVHDGIEVDAPFATAATGGLATIKEAELLQPLHTS